ncbi:hypothetical protein FHG87_007137 [Trinorchestia longiramus]|nr:hypothetical protein FHG87_007137 [Trinorchestia longiramus]
MAKLSVRVFVLIVLGTVSAKSSYFILSCEAVGQHPDSTAVMTASASLSGCLKPKTVNVRFSKLRVQGTDSDVVYQRTTITEQRLQYAAIATVDLPSTNIVMCAQAAAAEGLDVFVFDGNYTGYQLGSPLFKCVTDGLTIFVRSDKFANELWIINLGDVDCDSWIVDSGATQHMCNKQSEFSSYSDLSSPVRVKIGDGRALKVCHLRRSLQKKLSVFLGPSLKKKNMRIQKESWSSVIQLGTELLLIDLENGCALHKLNLMFLERSAYTKALLSRIGMDKANSVATPVDINADLVTTSDEVEDCDKDLYQSAVGSLL